MCRVCMGETQGMFGRGELSYADVLEKAETYGELKEAFLKAANVSNDAWF